MESIQDGREAPRGTAALSVLGSNEMLTHITRYLPGLPALLAAFLRSNSGLWSEDSRVGMVPRLAIRLGEQRIVEAVYRLLERGDCVYDDRISFKGSAREACACGNLQALQWLLQKPRLAEFTPPDLLDTAILHGRTATAKWLYATHPSLCSTVSSYAVNSTAQASRAELFAWIQEQQLAVFTCDAMAVAVRSGSVEILQTLHRKHAMRCEDLDAIAAAVDHGHVAVLDYIVENKSSMGDPTVAILTAYTRDKRPLAQRLLLKSLEASALQDMAAFRCAAQIGDVVLVQKLWGSADLASLEDATAHAVRCGHVDVVRFLARVYPTGIKPELLNEAIHHGHLAVVRYLLHERRLPCSDVALNLAAAHGHAELVKLIVQETNAGCLFYARRLAARSEGHAVVAQLTELMDPQLRYCEPKLHSREPTSRRRCERKQATPRKWRVW